MGCGKVVGFLLLFVLVVQCKVVLHGPTVYMEFEENLSLTKLASTPLENLLAKPATSLWYAQFLTKATKDKLIYVNATTPCAEKKYHKTGDAITFNWNGIKLEGTPYTVSAKLKVQLQTAPHGAAFHLSFEANGDSADNVSLWMWEVGVEQINVTLSHSVLQNAGFGFLHHCKSGGCQDWSDAYPQSTYQFLATYGARKHSGIYLASHDSHGEAKIFRCAVTKASERDIIPSSLSFYIASQPEGSGLGFKSYSVPYPIVLTTFSGNWWDASQIYREWVLPNADWTQRGTLRERADVPNWLLDLTIWVNSHWQELDILNRTGGEASVVKERVSNIARRFDIDEGGLGLHWYEWDTLGYTLGSDYSDCSTEVTCGFDTHYPEYFPARTGFDAAVKDLQDIGVRIAPYINGRIFDVATETWKRDQAEKWMAKKPKNPIFDPKDLELYEESYGSQAVFAVSCPDTDYWQDTIVNVTRRLLNVHAVDGIYIDQIAAAGPRLCWDPEHGHAIGGGHSWVDGYHKMLNGVRDAAGNNTMVLTESNAEPFMDGVDIYLSLVGFSGNFSGEERIVPVFPAIYGGYYISMGSVFFLEDLTHNTDVFAAKVAAQYLFGAQLGWFSLGGSDVQVPYMGMYEALMSPVYDPEVEFLKLLSRAKTAGNRWIQEGRAMRELLLVVNGTLPQKTVIQTPYHTPDHNQDYRMPHLHKPSLAFHSVMSAVWMDLKGESLLIALVTPKAGVGAHYYWKMNTVDFGFPVESYNQMFTLTQIFPEKKVIGDFKGCCVVQKALMEARSAITFVLTRK